MKTKTPDIRVSSVPLMVSLCALAVSVLMAVTILVAPPEPMIAVPVEGIWPPLTVDVPLRDVVHELVRSGNITWEPARTGGLRSLPQSADALLYWDDTIERLCTLTPGGTPLCAAEK